ncbi:metalloregulator ArsR/SmtB family transcription factor [Candidatus Cloacimonadaceae bacterium]
MKRYTTQAKLLRALGEPVRLAILDMISCGEMCACDILDGLTISQSTLSHHMRVLQQANIVISRKDATWVYYSINPLLVSEFHTILDMILLPKQNCICQGHKPEDDI